ncbi:MAG: LCP family protein [Chloroflexi bacterium]|nr:LCP family protein [Chloroflexota bacterium]
MPTLEVPPEVTNILLLGNDVAEVRGGRTDTLIIVSINRETGTAGLLSLPRDLYVYIPEWTMNRLNLALPHGHGVNYQGSSGGGGGLVKDTILYNFGLPVHTYARIGFDGFKQVIDTLGGVEVAASCSLSDWRLKSPELDPAVEDNWEWFTLASGVYQMDGDLALWYARSRKTTNDFDRNRRQQQLLSAMLERGLALDLLPQGPSLWEAFQDSLETDMSLGVMLELAALAPAVRQNGVQHLSMPQEALRGWRVPGSGEAVQLLRWEQAQPTLRQLVQPPVLNQATRPPIMVEVVTDNDVMYRLAAENLAWYGFVPVRGAAPAATPGRTQITYYGANFKGSFDWLLSWLFNQDSGSIQLVTGPAPGDINYRVVLGYDYNPCRSQIQAPPTPAAMP